MQFRILGPMEVVDAEGRSLPLGPPRQRALLALLVLHLEVPLSVDRLVDFLWGGAAPDTATTIVHGSIAGLRRALRKGRVRATTARLIVTGPGGYVLDVPGEQVDAIRFERLLSEGLRHLRTDPYRAAATLSEALSLWRGPALAGIDADFARDAAGRLEELRLDALEARMDADLALGRHAELVGELESLVARNPFRERLWAQLMVALYRCGRQADSLASYQTISKMLAEELGVLPGPELRDLEHAVLEHHPSLDAPGTVRGRSSLPLPLGVFIGRNRQQQEVASLLQSHRLVTLTGAAGIGKTRLAVEVARTTVGRFSAGTWFVDLAPLSTPELVAQTVADVLGVRAEAGMALADTVAAAMAHRQALLVLDNCEHVVQASSQLARAMLTAGPDIRVLATSREPLGIPGEAIFSVSPLAVARSDEPWERVAASEAVRLFGARAATARPGFQVTKANAGLIRDICHRLDGMPLALELAAAHIAGLPLADIHFRLDRRYRLLDAGAGAGHGRHRGLGAAVEWSYDLLTEPEQIVFERLSVFRGGFTIDAAEAVGTGEGITEADIAALLSRLVTRSLIQLEDASPSFARYRMLEPLRDYASERLNSRGGASTTSARHARHYFARVVEVEPHLYRAGSKRWLDRLRAENENVRAALEWSFSPVGDAQLGAAMAGRLWHVWDLSGARSEGLHWLDAGLQVVDHSHPEERMSLLAAATLLRLGLGDFKAANLLATEQLELALIVGNRQWEGDALTRLGTVAWARGDLQTAKPLYGKAVEVLGGAGDPWRLAIAEVHLARVQRDSGELNEANLTGEAALSQARQVGEDTVLGFALDVLASIAHRLHRSELASRLVEDALAHYRAVGYREGEASGLHMAGRLLLERGRNATAEQTFREALDLCSRIGHRAGIATSLEDLAQVMAAAGDDLGAATLLGAAAARREAIGVPMPTTERRAWDMDSMRLVTRFDADELERAWQGGADMSVEDLLREASALTERARPARSSDT